MTDEEGHLIKINERTHIEKHDGGTAYTEDDGKSWTMLPEGSIVSMNMWGFSNSILKELKERFTAFLDDAIKNNPMKVNTSFRLLWMNFFRKRKLLSRC